MEYVVGDGNKSWVEVGVSVRGREGERSILQGRIGRFACCNRTSPRNHRLEREVAVVLFDASANVGSLCAAENALSFGLPGCTCSAKLAFQAPPLDSNIGATSARPKASSGTSRATASSVGTICSRVISSAVATVSPQYDSSFPPRLFLGSAEVLPFPGRQNSAQSS